MDRTGAEYDALIIGGGPGGSTAATFLAKAGRRALVLEKERFPRFHIGESLLPYNRRIFQELGVLPALQAAGLVKKYGAQFHLGNASKRIQLVFSKGRFTREPEAFQVERAIFDQILLNHARSSGADVREGWTVYKFSSNESSVHLEARDETGAAQSFRGKFLIDASGRSNLTGNQEGIRVIHPRLKKLAIFGHFSGVVLDEGPKAGDTVIVRLENKWFWIIPLSAEKVSVGCVMDQEEFARLKRPALEVFEQTWRFSRALRERMDQARLIGPLYTTGDFSYRNRSFVGPRLTRVGDAAGFMDPIFSAGVYLAMYSAKLAAQAIEQALQKGNDGRQQLSDYESKVYASMQLYWEMVEHFYTTPFMEVFMNPQENFHLASAVLAVLAGELEGGWALRWRMRLFFGLVKLQRRFPIVPRIRYD